MPKWQFGMRHEVSVDAALEWKRLSPCCSILSTTPATLWAE
jgi:hypothetical protein